MSEVAQSPFVRVAILKPGHSSAEPKAQDSCVAQNGGVNPTWDKNFLRDFSFNVDDFDLSTPGKNFLTVKILAKNKYFPNRSIGEALIPLAGLKESPTNDVTSYPLVISTGGCLGRRTCQGTVSLTISVGPLVKTPRYRPCAGTKSSGGPDMLPGMAFGYAMG